METFYVLVEGQGRDTHRSARNAVDWLGSGAVDFRLDTRGARRFSLFSASDTGNETHDQWVRPLGIFKLR